MTNKKNYAVLIAALACAAGAHAGGNAYGSVAVGSVHGSNQDCTGTTRCDKSPTGVKLLGGYDFGNGFSLEGGYVNFGKFRSDTTTSTATGKPSALVMSAVFGVPMGDSWGANFKLGAAQVHYKGDYQSATLQASISESKLKYYAGLGLAYAITKSVKVELGVDMTQVSADGGHANLRLISLGTTVAF